MLFPDKVAVDGATVVLVGPVDVPANSVLVGITENDVGATVSLKPINALEDSDTVVFNSPVEFPTTFVLVGITLEEF